jgi:hypothetical protein
MTTLRLRPAAGLTTIVLTIGALAGPATAHLAAIPAPIRHPCPTLVVSEHPWQNVKDGKKTEWGDHWLLQWQGRTGSCARAAGIARSEISHPQTNPNCAHSARQGPDVVIRPFQRITCRLGRLGTKRATLVLAFVDPDPAFIHPGAAPRHTD